jgi:hypothetical protein
MTKGQRVKLSERGIKLFTCKPITLRGEVIDWKKRVGSITRFTPINKWVVVHWDGNKHPSEAISPVCLELLEEAVE